MNILLINYEYPPIGAGAANSTWHVARQLIARGCQVVVLTSGFRQYQGKSIEDGVLVYRCPGIRRFITGSNFVEMASFVISAGVFLPLILRKYSVDGAVVYFSIPCGPLGIWAQLLAHVPYVVSLRGGDVPGNESGLACWHEALRPLRRQVLKRSLAIVANSAGLKHLSERVDPFPVRVIPNGVDTTYFVPQPQRRKTYRFLFVGRFQSQKNLLFLLDQIRILKESTQIPFELHMVGDGPQKRELLSYARFLKLDDLVWWSGWCHKDKLLLHYQQADCLLNPSLCEGMPNTVLEAMACGLPVIASRVVGNDLLVRHGETGFLFELRKPETFQHAAQRLISDPVFGKHLGMRGRQEVEKEYSWGHVAEEYLHLLIRPPPQQAAMLHPPCHPQTAPLS